MKLKDIFPLTALLILTTVLGLIVFGASIPTDDQLINIMKKSKEKL